MKAPFPFFGGKRRAAPDVWAALGDVDNYCEPFAGSLAVLLERPGWHQQPHVETVNDVDCYLSNFWRAVSAAPEEVARWCDSPVNECVPAGTIIAAPGGDIPVEDVRPGMLVWGERDGRIVPTLVMAIRSSDAVDFVAIGSLRLTGNHPVWTPDGYIMADALAPGVQVGVLLAHEGDRPTLDGVRLDGPAHIARAVHRRDATGTSVRGTSIACPQERSDTSGLLDSQPTGGRIEAGDGPPGEGARHWLAGRRTRVDREVPHDGGIPDESHGRWRRNAGQDPIGGAENGPLQAHERPRFASLATSRDVGMAPLGAGEGGHRAGVCRTQTFYQGPSSYIKGSARPRHDHLRSHVDQGSNWRTANGCPQGEDSRNNHKPKAHSVRGNRAGISIHHGRIGRARGERSIGESVREEGLPLQRESLPTSIAVHNFQTNTGNYFAAGILVHNCDLLARHLWLVKQGRERIDKLEADPDFFDAQVAGWWVWGINAWIGSGWGHGEGAGQGVDGRG